MYAWLATAIAGTLVASPDLGAEEQAALERLQALRADPGAHVAALEAVLRAQRAADPSCGEGPAVLRPIARIAPRPPLAPHQALVDAARAHAADLIARGYFEHVSPEGIGPNQRAIRAGYPLPLDVAVVSEGPTGFGYSSAPGANQLEAIHRSETWASGAAPAPPGGAEWVEAVDALVVDRCVPGRGHREHLLGTTPLNAADRDVGVGGALRAGPHPDRPELVGWELAVAMETAARVDDRFAVVGVVWADADGDGTFDAGEGLPGELVRIDALGLETRTAPGGGYVLPVTTGFSGEVAWGHEARAVRVDRANVKIDFRSPP